MSSPLRHDLADGSPKKPDVLEQKCLLFADVLKFATTRAVANKVSEHCIALEVAGISEDKKPQKTRSSIFFVQVRVIL